MIANFRSGLKMELTGCKEFVTICMIIVSDHNTAYRSTNVGLPQKAEGLVAIIQQPFSDKCDEQNLINLRLQPWENPNNWVRVFVLPNCDGANVHLCLLTIINPIYLNAAGKPKVDQHPLNTHIWAALNIGADAEWVGDYKIDLKP